MTALRNHALYDSERTPPIYLAFSNWWWVKNRIMWTHHMRKHPFLSCVHNVFYYDCFKPIYAHHCADIEFAKFLEKARLYKETWTAVSLRILLMNQYLSSVGRLEVKLTLKHSLFAWSESRLDETVELERASKSCYFSAYKSYKRLT